MKSVHYARIHKRVALRVLQDTHPRVRAIIASDVAGETPEYKWFVEKVAADSTRLYEDPTYYDNQEFTFRVAQH